MPARPPRHPARVIGVKVAQAFVRRADREIERG